MKRAVTLAVPQALTSARLLLGASAAGAAVDGRLETAATLICLGAVTDGLDGFAARRLGATSSFGALYDYFADYLCYVFAPWAIARGLLPPDPGWRDAVLTVPLLTAAFRYAHNSPIAASPASNGEVPGLGTVFFAFLSVAAVFLDAKILLGESAFSAAFSILIVSFSLLMVAPFRCPKIARIPGMSPAVLVLVAIMPFAATKPLAGAMLIIGMCYPFAARLYARAH
jgi:phosphatidylserine synthase